MSGTIAHAVAIFDVPSYFYCEEMAPMDAPFHRPWSSSMNALKTLFI
jgi:hypothetical protein